MIRILLVGYRYIRESPGGSAKSFINIYNGLRKIENYKIQFLPLTVNKLNKFFVYLKMFNFFLIPRIIRTINKFKPHIILSQDSLGIPAIISARIKKRIMIYIARDVSYICPKNIDVVNYGKCCKGLTKKDTCFNCINNWRALRVFLGDKTEGWQYSLSAVFSTILFKIKYFFCRLNLKILNLSTIDVVASELMKSVLSNSIDSQKIKILNITPLMKRKIASNVKKEKQILFIIPRYKESHKGLHFILRLAKVIPQEYKIVIIGRKLSSNKLKDLDSKIINMGIVDREILDNYYQTSKITLVPSFCTEAFGRVIIESIVNKTPVISSPNCGANEFFPNKTFLKSLPLKISLWVEAIKDWVENPIDITDEEIEEVYHNFSIEPTFEQFKDLINAILKRHVLK